MFNLEQSIADWRKQMLAAGIKSPVPQEELESHLREETDRQIKLGLTPREAFETAAREIGQPANLKREFKKNERSIMKKGLIIGLGVLGVMIGMAWYQQHGAMPSPQWELLSLGVAIVVAGIGAAAYGLKMRKA